MNINGLNVDPASHDKVKNNLKLAKDRVAHLEKINKQLVADLHGTEKARRLVIPNPKKIKPSREWIRVIIPDSHGSHIDKKAAAAFLNDLAALNPNEIVMLGDHVDCGGFLAQHHTLGYVADIGTCSYYDDCVAANDFLDEIQKRAPNAKIHYIEGNHECLTPEHEVLTGRGWISVADVTKADTVATLNKEWKTEWQTPISIISKPFSGELVVGNNALWRSSMTPKHRICYKGQYNGDMRFAEIGSLLEQKVAEYLIPTAGAGHNNDNTQLSDDELRLAGWLLTDGCASGGFWIYQSKAKNIEIIRKLLTRMGISYSFRFRKPRKIKPIQGKTVKTSLPQGVFTILAKSYPSVIRILELQGWSRQEKFVKHMPTWVYSLSERQFNVLFSSVVAGDGTASSSGLGAAVYGTLAFLEELQKVAVVNGVRANLVAKTRKGKFSHWALYTKKSKWSKIPIQKTTREVYNGQVHCLEMSNSNFFTRKGGSVHVTGNCRVERWCVTETLRHAKDAEMLRQAFAPEFRLHLADRGITYYRRGEFYDDLPIPGAIKLGKCHFIHGISIAKNAAAVHVARFAGNVVYGDTHRGDWCPTRLVSVGIVAAWNPGCLCQLQPLWGETKPTDWSHGYAIQLVRQDGDFLHVQVPIIGGISLMGPMVNKITSKA